MLSVKKSPRFREQEAYLGEAGRQAVSRFFGEAQNTENLEALKEKFQFFFPPGGAESFVLNGAIVFFNHGPRKNEIILDYVATAPEYLPRTG